MDSHRRDRCGRPYTPMMDPELRRGKRPPNYGQRFPAEIYTVGEIRELMRCAGRGITGDRHRAQMTTMWRCGLRVAESCALEPRDVDLDALTVLVRHGKGNRRRMLGIDPGGAAIVEKWMRGRAQLRGVPRGAPLFITISTGNVGRSVQTPQLREAMKRMADRAGVEKRVHPHGLRHTFAVDLLREGVPLTMISKLLGHADLATTARYLDHLLPLEAVERLHARAWPEGAFALPDLAAAA